MTPADIAALRGLCERATAIHAKETATTDAEWETVYAFQRAARSALPALLDRIEELERAVAIRDTTVRVLKENQTLDAQRLAELNAAQAAIDAACIEHAELNGHIEIAEQALDWVAHERDLVDPSGKLEDFFKSLSVVIDQCEKQRRRANWHEAAHNAGKAKLIEQATAAATTARDKLAAECERLRALLAEAVELARNYVEHSLPVSRREADERLAAIASEGGVT